MTTVIVTGGFGYAGGRIVRKLLNDGCNVGVWTRRLDGDIPDWARGRVQWSDDLANLSNGAASMIHLAAPNEIICAAAPEKSIAETTELTQRAVNAAKNSGVRRFIYFSTVHVYGQMHGLIDEDTPTDPVHPYAAAHLQSEKIVEAASDSDFNAVTFRLSNGYGAPADTGTDRWTLLVNELCRQAAREYKLTLKSDGRQRRDFVPLSDIARATSQFATAPPSGRSYCVFNLSAGISMQVREMAALIMARAKLLLDKDITLHVPETASESRDDDQLVIGNQRLRDAGFAFHTDPADEIDGLLRFCMNNDTGES